jgi:predicted nucleic-acid-binding protein
MKAIDTNILVRILVKDDVRQGKKALDFIKNTPQVFIGSLVLVETIWVLEACYKVEKAELITMLEALFRVKQFVIQHIDASLIALKEFTLTVVDFSDCLIAAVAQARGCELTVTFDKKAARLGCFELL